VKNAPWLLLLIFCALPLGADTCLAPKNPVRAAVACGHVQDPAGDSVANVELQLVIKEQVVATTLTDAEGNFMFGSLPKGEYDLTTKSNGWHLYWPVKITSSKVSNVCKEPMQVKLGLQVCGAAIWKKGYHAEF
jgi:hypothetical protein